MIEAKYKELKLTIERDILSNVFEEKLPGVHRLAERYGMNHVTVSKALRTLEREGKIAIEGTRGTRILRKQERKKYQRVAYVGLIYIESRESPYIRALETVCGGHGYEANVMRFTSPASFLKAGSMLASLEVDGMIFAYCRPDHAMLTELATAGKRSIQLARTSAKGVSWVDADNERGITSALSYLHENGHRRIMFCSPRNRHEESQRMIDEAYRSYMRSIDAYDASLYFCPDTVDGYIRRYGENYRRAFGTACAEHLLSLKERPSAVYVHAIETAHAMTEALAQKGISVPGDISVIAATDDENGATQENFLTLLMHPRIEMVRRAGESLIRAIEDNASMEDQLLERKLIINRSVQRIS